MPALNGQSVFFPKMQTQPSVHIAHAYAVRGPGLAVNSRAALFQFLRGHTRSIILYGNQQILLLQSEPPPDGAGFRCQPPESGLPGPGFPMRKAFTHNPEKKQWKD